MAVSKFQDPVFQRLALVAGIATCVALVFSETYSSMWALWQTTDHRHGLLVFPISAYLIWRLRDQLANEPLSVEWSGLLLVTVLAATWAIARLAGIQVVEHAASIGMVPAMALTVMGGRVTREMRFPLLFLLFALPVGDSAVPYLMIVTADISSALLRLSAIPVFREGQNLTLPGGNFYVAEVCSGLRYLVTGVMISLLYGYLTYTNWKKRFVLVAITSVLLVIANGVRAYIVMAIASATNLQLFGGRDHIYFGWIMFGIVMMAIMWVGARYEDEPDAVPGDSPQRAGLPIIVALGLIMLAITVKPLQADFGETGTILVALAALALFIVFLSGRKRSTANSVREEGGSMFANTMLRDIFIPTAAVGIIIVTSFIVAEIESVTVPETVRLDLSHHIKCPADGPWRQSWQPEFVEPDAEQAMTFRCGDIFVNAYSAAYSSARQGRELVSSAHKLIPTSWDHDIAVSDRTVKLQNGKRLEITEITKINGDAELIVWYWYDVNGSISSSPLITKVSQVAALMRKRPAGGRVVLLAVETGVGEDLGREQLQDVARALISNSISDQQDIGM